MKFSRMRELIVALQRVLNKNFWSLTILSDQRDTPYDNGADLDEQ